VSKATKTSGRADAYELALRPLDTHRVYILQPGEYLLDEGVTGATAQVEVQVSLVAGTARDRERCLRPIAEREPHRLPGEEAQPVAARRLQVQQAHVIAHRAHRLDARIDRLQRHVGRAVRLARLDHQVGRRRVAAHEHRPRGLLGRGKGVIRVMQAVHLAGDDARLALAAAADAAAVIER